MLELADEPKVFADVRAKVPGPEFALGRGRTRLALLEAFPEAEPLEAYERLVLDVLRGDRTLFTDSQEIELVWQRCDPADARSAEPGAVPERVVGPAQALGIPREHGRRLPDS
ncbi:MAG TPA: hypothetical protein VE196_07870 [Pseudonocardiaceae bacterium]|nr:hypothetical protein [Pseudonocardiaceae bacterium]